MKTKKVAITLTMVAGGATAGENSAPIREPCYGQMLSPLERPLSTQRDRETCTEANRLIERPARRVLGAMPKEITNAKS